MQEWWWWLLLLVVIWLVSFFLDCSEFTLVQLNNELWNTKYGKKDTKIQLECRE